ncbi:MAG TPA: pilin [Candidatus Saccharimonadales bacterium]|nr:pilin [Candidatus Saccharimonadales bacterium]
MNFIFLARFYVADFLGFPTWYQYLPANPYDGSPQLTSLSDVWLIAAAIIDILLRVAALITIIMVIYGGIEFITSQGDPEKAKNARGTVVNGLIGLVIAISATTLISFIAGRFN